MHLKYKDENIEFANRVLNHRDELDSTEVAEWLNVKENCELLDELARVKCVLENRKFSALKRGELLRLRKAVTVKRISVGRWWMTVAAGVLIALGVGILGWQKMVEIRQRGNIEQIVEICPGSVRAELVLAGGRSIALGKGNVRIDDRAVKGIVNDSLEGLNYSGVAVEAGQADTLYNTLKVPAGGFYKLELPDGTRVWLNAASELKFPVQFSREKREVYLSGEGYFQVTKDTSRQFVVHLNNSAVTVLGTKFNVSAYENEASVYTTLVEGAVAFHSVRNRQQVLLKPGMQSVMEVSSGKTSTVEIDPADFVAWVEGRFIFRAMNLGAIMRQLQRWYDFEIFYQNPEVEEYVFRGVIERDMSIEKVLGMIKETTDVNFDVKGKTIIVYKP